MRLHELAEVVDDGCCAAQAVVVSKDTWGYCYVSWTIHSRLLKPQTEEVDDLLRVFAVLEESSDALCHTVIR